MLAAVPALAQIGFQAALENPAPIISAYDEESDEFSVAIYPKSYKNLSSRLNFKPKSTESNYELNSIRFETDFYGRGKEKYSLIPMSVDANEFMRYRFRVNYLDGLNSSFSSSIVDVDKRKKRSGLGLHVQLPKRLEQIFGEGTAGLKVSGYKKVSFAGQSRWNDDAVTTSGISRSKFPTLKMDQIDRFDITGTIGTKITVKVSQDSQTDIPLANRIQIRYKGDDDDILKVIEAGNTTLSLPNTKFVGYSSRIRGLFGLKAEAQIGNLRIIGIASQEKGASERTTFSANGEENPEFLRDYEYAERRIFDLGLHGEYDNDGNVITPPELLPSDTVKTLLLYEQTRASDESGTSLPYANFYVDWGDTLNYSLQKIKGENNIQVRQIDDNQFSFYNDASRGLHYVVFNTSRSRNYHIGCYMEVIRKLEGGGDTLITFGSLIQDTLDTNTGRTLYKLKLLYRSDPNKNYPTWKLMWRNCYPIPKGAQIEDLKLKIYMGLPGTEMQTGSNDPFQEDNSGNTTDYLEILGLDLGNSSSKNDFPDGEVDEKIELFRPDWGLLIFPNRTPFNSEERYTHSDDNVTTPELDMKVPILYSYSSYTEMSEQSQYYIRMTTTTHSSIIRLNKANIIEGSERITVNGKLLKKGVDYNIQYDFGQVTLLSDDALDPNANIDIDFEYAPFFAVQKKSLLGFRAEYEWSKDLKFGSTFLYKSDKAQERKPKVGQETARTVIFDADLSLKLHPNFLTSVVNAIPLIETEAPSNMTISGEIAQSHPNPNVNDIAYVDDFESALDNLSLGTSRTNWRHASFPYSLDESEYAKGRILWHTPNELIPTEEVYDRETEAGGGAIRTFRMRFTPQNYKYEVSIDDSTGVETIIDSTLSKSWGGFMTGFGKRVDDNRAQLFEVRLKIDTANGYTGGGKLHFDFGRINEDVNGNELADSEDFPPVGDGDTYVSPNEDVGLDGLPDSLEPGYDAATNPDPNGDNWFSFSDNLGKCPLVNGCDNIDSDDPIFYDYLNGTEGNISDGGATLRPDKESFTSFNLIDSYYAFELDLKDHPDSFLVEGSERNDWVTYRIPIRDSLALAGLIISDPNTQPEWSEISHVRVWLEADEYTSDPISIEVADWYFVQMNWQDTVVYSPLSEGRSNFIVAAISDDVNEDFEPPKGVEAYEDPTTNVAEVQKALQLSFTELDHRDTCLATKDLLTVDRYSGYRRLEMYVHGDESPANSGDMEKVRFFFRIGRDDNNYYEYHTKIYPGWDDRNHVNFDFNEVTALKDSAQQTLEKGLDVDVSNDKYRVFGNPNINEIKYFAAGVVNEDTTQAINGEVWLDELRVTDVRKDVGTAGRISVTGNMADFISYNFSLQSKDPYFRGLSSATRGGSQNNLGSGRHETNMTSSLTLNMQKFLPRSWKASLPITFAYSKSTQTPLLRNNSDIVLPEAVRLQEQRISESKSMNVSIRFNKKTKNPIFSMLLNRLKTRFSYRRSNQKSVNSPYSFGENIDVSSDYNLSVKSTPRIPIFFFLKSIPILKKASNSKLSFYPEIWTMSGRFNRSITVNDDVNFNRRSSVKRNFTGTVKMTYKMFDNLSTTLNYDTRHDLTDLDNVVVSSKVLKLGLQTHYSQRFSLTYDPRLLNFFTASFSFKSNYTDDWERSNESRRSTLSRNMSLGGKFDHQALLGGKSSGGERRFRGRRGDGRRRNVKEKDKEKEDKEPFYAPVLKGIRKITGWINPISYTLSSNFSNSLPGMANRPSLKYRFGLLDDALVDRIEDSRNQQASEGESVDLSSGFTFLGGLTTTVKYRQTISRDLVKVNKKHKDISTSWPDLSIRIKKFKNLPLIQSYVNKFIEVFSPRTGYSKSKKESIDILGNFPTSRSVSENYNPLLQVNFKLFRSLSLSSSYSKNKSFKYNFNTLNGDEISTTTTEKKTFALSTKYSFSSPHGISIPIFGKLKFKSQVDLSMNVKLNSSITSNYYFADSSTNEPVNKSDIAFSPVVAYTFSQQIKGGLTMVWKDSNDKIRKTHYREVKIWTEIRF